MVQHRLITSLSQKSFAVLRLSAVSFGPTPIDHLSQPKVIRSIKASRSFVWSDTADPFKLQQNPAPQTCGPGSSLIILVVSVLPKQRRTKAAYIMPPMPPMPPPPIGGIGGMSSLMSVTPASVVRSIADAEAAFCRADLVTLAGSTMPAPIMST